MKTISIVMFDDFETLDAFGPAEVLSKLDGYEIRSVSLLGGIVTNSQGIMVVTERMLDVQDSDILIVPGGMGTRTLVTDDWFLSGLGDLASKTKWVLSVCTGSALLAAAGIWTAATRRPIRMPLTGSGTRGQASSGKENPAGSVTAISIPPPVSPQAPTWQ